MNVLSRQKHTHARTHLLLFSTFSRFLLSSALSRLPPLAHLNTKRRRRRLEHGRPAGPHHLPVVFPHRLHANQACRRVAHGHVVVPFPLPAKDVLPPTRGIFVQVQNVRNEEDGGRQGGGKPSHVLHYVLVITPLTTRPREDGAFLLSKRFPLANHSFLRCQFWLKNV